MFDETLQRLARRQQIAPIDFQHPKQSEIADCFNRATTDPVSVILTGTAGDGKTHLCRQVWKALRGSEDDWASDNPYLAIRFLYPNDRKTWPESEELVYSTTFNGTYHAWRAFL
jgi:Cdc6-like AAA superfamily ATPase